MAVSRQQVAGYTCQTEDMKKLTLFLAVLAFFAASRAVALELSLEENKGESGTIGYVDIDRVFKEFSGTSNARDEFLAEIKAKEDSLNLKKQAIFSLKADIAKLRQEREFALTLPGLMRQADEISAATAANAVNAAENSSPHISVADSANGLRQASVSTQTVPVQLSTGMVQSNLPVTNSASGPRQASVSAADSASGPRQASVSSDTAKTRLPATTIKTASPLISTQTAAAQLSDTAVSSRSAPAALPAGLPGMAGLDTAASRVPADYFKFSVSTSAAEIDSAIAAKEADLAKKQEDLHLFQRQTEKELLDYETHKSEMILGRIYIALQELAIKEGVSVVVDKRTILFGHSAVDLTGKLIEKLEENPI